MNMNKILTAALMSLVFVGICAGAEEQAAEAVAQATAASETVTEVVLPAPSTADYAMFAVNNLWVMAGGMLVFLMHLGFACVESGLARAKNCNNILFKNTMTPAIGFLSYAICGFALMYPGVHWIWENWFGFAGFGLHLPPDRKSVV